jgi:sarcosine oxidase subunit alpha
MPRSGTKRLPWAETQRIDREHELPFTFNGRRMIGLAGDSVASALFASRVRIISRSIKYHRPRGLYGLDGETSNGLMEIDELPNCRAETTLLRAGMAVKPQNVAPTPDWDAWGVMDKLDWAMPAGFYYRQFHKPYDLWPFFLKQIRRAAGIGRLRTEWSGGPFDEFFVNTDVCVLGGGPAGLSAALAAADHGLRVTLIEARPWLGGFYDWRVIETDESQTLHQRGRELAQAVAGRDNLTVLTHTFVNGLWGDNLVTAFQVGGEDSSYQERYVEVRATSVVTATGCRERPLLFEHNERPGVMQVGCAHRLARTYGLLAGEKAVFSVGHDLGLEAAVDLHDLGLRITAVADCRVEGHDQDLVEALAQRGIPFMTGWAASRAEGDKVLSGVVLSSLDGANRRRMNCDALVASAGLSPDNGPLSVAGATFTYDRWTNFHLPETLPPRIHAAGRMLGHHHPTAVEASGRLAGLAAARDCGRPVQAEIERAEQELAAAPPPPWGSKLVLAPGIEQGRKTFICFDEDATVKHVAQACQQGFDLPELAKRFTATGTGPGQGGIPGHNLPLLIAQFRGESHEKFSPTTVRPPLVPTLLATYVAGGRHLFKHTPLHQVQAQAGGVFQAAGDWQRARYFSDDLTCAEEVAAVRERVGLIDVSTLGKFRLFGPDALAVLQRIYAGDISRVRAGRLTYVAMCNDDGCLIDDGVMVKLADNDYYFTTSSGRAGQTVEWFLFHSRYENWDYGLVDLTDAWAAVNLAGPLSGAVMQRLSEGDASVEDLPYLGFIQKTLAGEIPARVLRLGFVGEVSFEIHVPASWARALWDRLIEAGREFSITPFGLEAQNQLRLEKGHVIIGQDTELRTNLIDLGLGWLWDRGKTEAKTVGAAALAWGENQPGRLKLVGFMTDDPDQTPGDGAIVVDDEAHAVRGHVTSARYSQTLERSIGLALVADPWHQEGTRLQFFQAGLGRDRIQARVAPTPFYDPQGLRLRG